MHVVQQVVGFKMSSVCEIVCVQLTGNVLFKHKHLRKNKIIALTV